MKTATPELQLLTPEGVELTLPLASIKSRVVAFLADTVLSLAVSTGIGVIGSLLGLTGDGTGWVIILLGLFFVRHGYFIWFETAWNGVTPGKRWMRIRVVPYTGGVLTLEAVVARNILRDIEVLLPVTALLAPETIIGPSPAWLTWVALAWVALFNAVPFLTRERVRAGDLVAGSVVIQEPTAILLPDQAGFAHGAIAFTPKHLSVYGERELETLATVLRRWERGEVDLDDLAVIAVTIARKVKFRGSLPHEEPLEFLRAFYRAQRAELERKLVMGKRKADKLDRA